jgi:hypothetical protein
MILGPCETCGASGFARAIEELKSGRRVARDGWNGKGMWLEVQRPDRGSKMTLPYIFMRTAQGDLVPWLASQSDMLAEDWRVVEPSSAPEPWRTSPVVVTAAVPGKGEGLCASCVHDMRLSIGRACNAGIAREAAVTIVTCSEWRSAS